MIGFLFALLAAPTMATWDLNDVSMLLPLPSPGEEHLMWASRTVGRHGELLPAEAAGQLPHLVAGQSQPHLLENLLKVVAVRIDPCFQEGPTPVPCQRQVRLVWQPVLFKNNQALALDAAVHSFYLLDDSQWRSLLQGLRDLKSRRPGFVGLPLQIHPMLRTDGYRGAYWPELSRVLLSFIGQRNLIRLTAMTVNGPGNLWVFVGLDRTSSGFQRIRIPRTDAFAQSFLISLRRTDEFNAVFRPEPRGEETLVRFMRDSRPERNGMSEAELIEVTRRAFVFENPRLSNPGTADCVSCHATRALPFWAASRFPRWDWGRLFAREIHQGPGPLVNTSVNPTRTNVLRAFGYFDRDAIISQRTVNESSAVLEALTREEGFRRW